MKRKTSDFRVEVTQFATVQIDNVRVIERTCELLLESAKLPRSAHFYQYILDDVPTIYVVGDRGDREQHHDQSRETKEVLTLVDSIRKMKGQFIV